MTAVGTRPSGLTTLEQDIVRQIMAFKDCNPQTAFREEGEAIGKACVWNVKSNDSGELYFVARVIVELEPLIDSGTVKKLFMRAKEFTAGATSYPTGYTTT